jgi:outer membrane biosynthesis protein TonB
MSKLMWIAGILLIAAGVALGAMLFVSTSSVIAWLTFESVVLMLVGGILSLGLGSVINGLNNLPAARTEIRDIAVTAAVPAASIPEFGRRSADAAPVAAVATAAVTAAAAIPAAREPLEVSEPTRETIQALEQARQKIEQAFDPKPKVAEEAAPAAEQAVASEPEPEPETAPEEPTVEAEALIEEEVVAEEDVLEEGQLYVVEERVIRMRPARILSDGTVEAETDDGWMRFENLEHLDEYLDAMAPAKA